MSLFLNNKIKSEILNIFSQVAKPLIILMSFENIVTAFMSNQGCALKGLIHLSILQFYSKFNLTATNKVL